MTKEAPVKRPMGRPSKYKPEYCDRAIMLGKEGYSMSEIAAEFEVDRASLIRWCEEHEDFRTALRAAKTFEQAWFEREARMNMKNRDFNSNLWYRSAASRFRDDYTERKEVSGPDGGAMKVETTTKLDTRMLDQDQREMLEAVLLAAVESKNK